jgi:tetratricopeptide (TPR) repeat protein
MKSTPNLQRLWQTAQQHDAAARFVEAETLYRELLDGAADFHPAWHALGILAVNAGKLPLALELVGRAAGLAPEVMLYQRNLGELLRRTGALEQAIACGRRAAQLAPGDLDSHYNLGLALADARQYDAAIASYRQALALNPGHGLSWNNLGSALEQRDAGGDKLAAGDAYAHAVALNPQHAEAQNNLGAILSEQGRLDEARAAFEAAIAARGDFVDAHFNYSSLHRYRQDDPHLAMLRKLHEQRGAFDTATRIRYGFALGKALDDIGDHDGAFAAYAEGNRLQHAQSPVNEAAADALLASIVEVFDADFFARRAGWRGEPDDTRVPVFIVGMPRSGTTLLEQILCSHPSVHGAGELVELSQAVNAYTPHASENFASAVQLLDEADLKRIGDDYLQRVWQLSPDSRYITDKMPANFFYLGLIHLALPQAKIIHAMRDPMDSCFSCFSRLFNDSMSFAYDQGTLGRYYVRYMTLMQHWQKVLPAGSFLDLAYEDMVADTEGQARRLLDFVGLPWDADCLKFHENKRPVKTASVNQVRQPIYRSSVARWKPFAAHLQPLYALVRDWRRGEDAAEVEQLMAGDSLERLHGDGIALYRQDRFAEALDCYERALALRPDAPSVLNSKGFALQDLGQTAAAHACFERAVALAPGFAMARLNLALAQLKRGDWAAGWDNYEARWTGSAEAGKTQNRPDCPLPQWDGQGDCAAQSLLVITEQGFGDVMMMARYLPLLAERFARVGFACSQPTLRLMEWSFGDRLVMLSELPKDFSAWDWQCPLMSLPRAFGTRPESIPANLPYLRAAAPQREYWRARLDAAAPGQLRIGLAWSGRPSYSYDARRSLPLEQLHGLLQAPGVTWVSLQKWQSEADRVGPPAGVSWLDWTAELSDFAASAALIANLDLIVSIDSVIVHLAGALDVPVWMLDRFDNEWRWLEQREDSPWYPRLRIFRQARFGDWSAPIEAARAALAQLPRPVASPSAEPATASFRPAVAPAVRAQDGLQLAGQLQSAGRVEEAERVLLQVLAEQPRNAQALHLLGVTRYQLGRPDEALPAIVQAIELAPQVALFHSNLAEMLRQRGRVDDAIAAGERAVALDPTLALALSNLGVAYHDAGDFERAQACHDKALALQPGLVQSLNNLGSIERARKNPQGAIENYRRALACRPDYVESMSNLAAVLLEEDRADEALPLLERALELAPRSAEALCNLGLVRLRQERRDEALALIGRALQLRAEYPEGLLALSRCLNEMDRLDEAVAALSRATEIKPSSEDAWCQLAMLLSERGDSGEAEAAYFKALALKPRMADALTGLGNLRLEEGKVDEAVRLTEEAIAAEPDHFAARFHLTQARKVKPGDSNLAALEALAAQSGHSDAKRLSLHYGLGKAYDDLQEYERAFPHFLEGARLKRKQLEFSVEQDDAFTRRIIDTVDAAFIERLRGAGEPSELPVFVLGMPRSGTTLTEQIIASHPQAHGAGELRDLMLTLQTTASGALAPFPQCLDDLTPERIARMGGDYLQRLRAHAPGAKRITDKMPANYLGLGVIPLLLPRAKIVHVQRDPVDTCLSCFTRLFNRRQEATYDLYELGRHYANYQRLMAHWRALLPAGSFLDVQYEDIVADMEGQARRLIDYCELPWDAACLAFHETRRNVRTASVTQVRQPIYSSSVQRWRHYERFLGPLLDGLGEFAPPRATP